MTSAWPMEAAARRKTAKQRPAVVVARSGRPRRQRPPLRSGKAAEGSRTSSRPPDRGGDGRRRDQNFAAALRTAIPASRRPDWGRTWSGQHGDAVAGLGGVERRPGGVGRGGGGARTGAARRLGFGRGGEKVGGGEEMV